MQIKPWAAPLNAHAKVVYMEATHLVERKQFKAIHTIIKLQIQQKLETKAKLVTFSKQAYYLYLTTSKCGIEDS